MRRRIIGCLLGLVLLTLTAGGALAASPGAAGGDRLAAGYHVKMHPDSHIALFMKKPLVATNPHLWAAYLLVMIGLGVAALILLYAQKDKELTRKLELADQEDGESVPKLKEKHDQLLQLIKQLDQQFNAGEVETQQYQETREKYKELLVRVKLQLKELS
ncbi:MAG TPA: hypothetical protein VFF14_00345 [Candidatus Deferrimicrobium sp.]|nr:hypothetical protein [Candidatus Deferrimicrobium sp.]